MFCRKCGSKHQPDSSFCSNCGLEIETAESEKSDKTRSSHPMPVDTIQCWRCGNSEQVHGIACTSCGVAKPESREASIAPTTKPVTPSTSDPLLKSWQSRTSATNLKKDSVRAKREAQNASSANTSLVLGYVVTSVAVTHLIKAQSLISNEQCNFFGTIEGQTHWDIFTKSYYGCSYMLTEELAEAAAPFQEFTLNYFSDRPTFTATAYAVTACMALVAALLFANAKKRAPEGESSRFFFFYFGG